MVQNQHLNQSRFLLDISSIRIIDPNAGKEKKRIHYICGTFREKAKEQLYKYNRPQEKFQNVFAKE